MSPAIMAWLKPLIEALAPIFEVFGRLLIEQIEKPQPAARVDEGAGPVTDDLPVAYDPRAETKPHR